ncbi:hypothetical protein CEXT_473091 [Caerostris extrusa]|uniref:Uncharacterized protein n=1 Tax=Caerostris extrusa TaxID=172846 RepID=A0AAV4NHJ7_CAEEX|nr:hypothetical protein CEXT_473091 [Caerostris extrusa]
MGVHKKSHPRDRYPWSHFLTRKWPHQKQAPGLIRFAICSPVCFFRESQPQGPRASLSFNQKRKGHGFALALQRMILNLKIFFEKLLGPATFP